MSLKCLEDGELMIEQLKRMNERTNERKVSGYHANVIIDILVPRYRENGEIQFGEESVLFSLESHDNPESNYSDAENKKR